MKFVMSYSCGKDSTFALHKMIEAGHAPVCLLVMMNTGAGRSYFHGADTKMLKEYESALGLPMIPCPSDGADYGMAFEEGLCKAKDMGAEAVAFGDIDIEENRIWEEKRCRNAGLMPFFPLWQCGRESNVRQMIQLRYRCLIKSVNHSLLPESLLGQYIDENTVRVIANAGVDICGENGEYHTLVTDGPIFKAPLNFETGDILRFGKYSVIEIS